MNRARYIITFIVIMLSIGINVGQQLLQRMNIDRNFLVITLVAIAVSGLIAHRQLFFIVLVIGLTASINLPAEMLSGSGINPDVLFATLLAVIIAPTGMRLMGVGH